MSTDVVWVDGSSPSKELLSRKQLCHWNGAKDWEQSKLISGGDLITDYDQACALNGHIGTLPVADEPAIILTDKAGKGGVTVLERNRSRSFRLIRWVGAESDEQIIHAAMQEESKGAKGRIFVNVRCRELRLMDATEYEPDFIFPYIDFSITPGRYSLTADEIDAQDCMFVFYDLILEEELCRFEENDRELMLRS